MKRITSLLIFACLPGWFCSGQIQETNSADSNEFVSPDYGFKISRPDANWLIKKTNPKPDSLMVKISRRDAVGKIEVTVVADARKDEPVDKIRAATIGLLKNQETYFNLRKKSFVVAGKPAPGFQVDWKIGDTVYRVHQCYLDQQGFSYTIAIHSPVEQFESNAESMAAIRDTIQFVPINAAARQAAKLSSLASRCGSEVNWARTWDAASKRAAKENKSVLVLIRSQSGFDLADGFMTVALMNEDIIELVNEKCVVFRFEKGMSAPFTSYEKYGIGPSSFGNTALLVDPDGTVFGDTFSAAQVTFYDFLVTSLRRQPTKQPPAELSKALDVAKWFVRQGELSLAAEQLSDDDFESVRLRAGIYRRQRRIEDAIRELQTAKEKTTNGDQLADVSIDETVMQLVANQMETETALRHLNEILQADPQISRRAELLFLIGVCQFAQSDKLAAEKTWLELIESFDENNRWTWQAASALKSTAFRLNVAPTFESQPENVVQSFRHIPFEVIDSSQIDRAEKEAIKYLVDHQCSDGSWISPPDALNGKGKRTSPFTIAITSICANSLLPNCDDEEIALRIAQAFEFLVESTDESAAKPADVFYMDYSPWSDAYLLRFLARYSSYVPDRREEIERIVQRTVSALAGKQKPGGGWSYYVTHNLAQANKPSNQSISFMTAAVCIALFETRQAGFAVPIEVTDKAVECLELMRNPNQTYTYFLWHENEQNGRTDGKEGAAGRGPLCTLALSMAGRNKHDDVIASLDLFMEQSHLYARERGKSLMHAAPGGQGSHYLMFDYAWAAAAAASLPDGQVKKYRRGLLDLILTSRSQQGCYLDNPINGWHYGTAMALEAFDLLRR